MPSRARATSIQCPPPTSSFLSRAPKLRGIVLSCLLSFFISDMADAAYNCSKCYTTCTSTSQYLSGSSSCYSCANCGSGQEATSPTATSCTSTGCSPGYVYYLSACVYCDSHSSGSGGATYCPGHGQTCPSGMDQCCGYGSPYAPRCKCPVGFDNYVPGGASSVGQCDGWVPCGKTQSSTTAISDCPTGYWCATGNAKYNSSTFVNHNRTQCPSGYQAGGPGLCAENSTAANGVCWGNFSCTKACTQTGCTTSLVPGCSSISCTYGSTSTSGTEAKYANGTIRTACNAASSNCSIASVNCATCSANYYKINNETCGACSGSYPSSDSGSTSQNNCYGSFSCTKACTQQSCPANAASCSHGSTTTSGTEVKYYNGTIRTACNAASSNCSLTVNSCNTGYYLSGSTCPQCTNKPSAASFTGTATSNSCPWSITCSAGTYFTGGNSGSCAQCDQNTYNGSYTWTQTKTTADYCSGCSDSQYAAPGSSSCTSCASGYARNCSGAAQSGTAGTYGCKACCTEASQTCQSANSTNWNSGTYYSVKCPAGTADSSGCSCTNPASQSCTPTNAVSNAYSKSCPSGTQSRTHCANNTYGSCSTSCTAATCNAGYYLSGGTCPGCPSNSSTSANNSASGCTCNSGYTTNGAHNGSTGPTTSACSSCIGCTANETQNCTTSCSAGYKSTTGTEYKYCNNGTSAGCKVLAASWADCTASCTGISFSVVYNSNGGSGSQSSTSCTYGGTCTLVTSTTFTAPSGYTFDGWATSTSNASNGTKVTTQNNATTTDGGSVTVYAVWKRTDCTQSNTISNCSTYNTPTGTQFYGGTCGAANRTCTGCAANHYLANSTTCTACTSGYTVAAGAGTAASDCKITCGVGYYVASSGAACNTCCGNDYYCPGGAVAQGSTGIRTACPANTKSGGCGALAAAAGDCVAYKTIKNSRNTTTALLRAKKTAPAGQNLCVNIGGTIYYGNLTTNTVTGAIKINVGGTVYNLTDNAQ